MSEKIKLYPPGGGMPIIPHPTKVEEMKVQGWTEDQPKKVKPKSKPKSEE